MRPMNINDFCGNHPEYESLCQEFIDDWLFNGNESSEVFIKDGSMIMAIRHSHCEMWIIEDDKWVLCDPGTYLIYNS